MKIAIYYMDQVLLDWLDFTLLTNVYVQCNLIVSTLFFIVTTRTTDFDPVEMAGNQAELATLIKRLEAVTLRLEKVPGGGPAQDGGNVIMVYLALVYFL